MANQLLGEDYKERLRSSARFGRDAKQCATHFQCQELDTIASSNNNNHIDEEKSSCHEVRSHQQQRRRRRQQVAGVCECRRALFPAERTPAGRPRTFRPLSRGVARTLISGRHVASSSSLGVLTPFATSTSAVNVWTAFKQEEFGFLSRPFIRRSRSRRRNGRYKVQIWCWVLQQVLDFRYVNESLLSIPNIQCRCAARYHFWNILQHLSTCDVLCIVLNYFQNISNIFCCRAWRILH